MAIINVIPQDTFEIWRQKNNQVGDFIGDNSDLDTTAQTLVAAINEIRNDSPIGGTINTHGNVFAVQIDNPDSNELELTAEGVLSVNGHFAGPLTGDVTGNLTGNVSGDVTGDLNGNADTASSLATARNIAITGDATWNVSFSGSADVTAALTLANTGVTAGSNFTKFNVDAKGRVTSATSITSTDIHNVLGYTTLSTTGKAADSSLLNGVADNTAASLNTIAKRDSAGDLYAIVFHGTSTTARYADLAEKYTTDVQYPVGTVITVAAGGDSEATASWKLNQLAIGVISEFPAYLMNSASEGQAVALKGRVPVRVIGPVNKGDTVYATVEGRAIVGGEMNPLGIALESNESSDEKLVECVIL